MCPQKLAPLLAWHRPDLHASILGNYQNQPSHVERSIRTTDMEELFKYLLCDGVRKGEVDPMQAHMYARQTSIPIDELKEKQASFEAFMRSR